MCDNACRAICGDNWTYCDDIDRIDFAPDGSVYVHTNRGRRRLSGVLDREAEIIFTSGHCHSLALALHELTGWELIGNADLRWGIDHVGVRLPDGRVLDVTGLYDNEHAWTSPFARPVPVNVDVAYNAMNDNYREPRVDVALPYARLLLEREGLAEHIRESALAA